jgi:hypothetical protein
MGGSYPVLKWLSCVLVAPAHLLFLAMGQGRPKQQFVEFTCDFPFISYTTFIRVKPAAGGSGIDPLRR